MVEDVGVLGDEALGGLLDVLDAGDDGLGQVFDILSGHVVDDGVDVALDLKLVR